MPPRPTLMPSTHPPRIDAGCVDMSRSRRLDLGLAALAALIACGDSPSMATDETDGTTGIGDATVRVPASDPWCHTPEPLVPLIPTTSGDEPDTGGSGPEPMEDAMAPVLVIDEPLVLCGYVSASGATKTAPLARKATLLPGRYPLPIPVRAQRDAIIPVEPRGEIALRVLVSDGTTPLGETSRLAVGTRLGYWAAPIRGVAIADPEFLWIDGSLEVERPPGFGGRWTLRVARGVPKWDPNGGREVHLRQGTRQDAEFRHVSLSCGDAPDDPCIPDDPWYGGSFTVMFEDCGFPWEAVRRWTLEYPEGELTLDAQARTGDYIKTEDRILLRAQGVHRGRPWQREGPLGLSGIWCPECSNVLPVFSVFFEEPIDDACGFQFGADLSSAYFATFSCDLTLLDRWPYESVSERYEELPFDQACVNPPAEGP